MKCGDRVERERAEAGDEMVPEDQALGFLLRWFVIGFNVDGVPAPREGLKTRLRRRSPEGGRYHWLATGKASSQGCLVGERSGPAVLRAAFAHSLIFVAEVNVPVPPASCVHSYGFSI